MKPRIHAPTAIEPAFRILDEFLESRVSQGYGFELDQTIQLWWMWFKVGGEPGALKVLSPEFGKMPMCFQEDCSDGLMKMITQKFMADSFVSEHGWCDACQGAMVIKDFQCCEKIFIDRIGDEEDGDSGWYLGAYDSKLDPNKADNIVYKSLWEVSCDFPILMDFFLLPKGWQVALEEKPKVLRGFDRVLSERGSYYFEKYGC